MQKVFSFLLLFALISPAFAQGESATLFGGGNGEKPKIGFYVSPAYQLSSATGQITHTFAGHAGMVINRRFTLGGSFSQSVNEFTPDTELDQDLYLDLIYAGLRAEYILNPEKLVAFSFPLIVGGGEASMDFKDGADNAQQGFKDFGEAYFLFVEPGVNAEIILVKHVRLTAGASCRLAGGLDYSYFNNAFVINQIQSSDISGFNFNIGLRFGIF